jgi:hypothetical protein
MTHVVGVNCPACLIDRNVLVCELCSAFGPDPKCGLGHNGTVQPLPLTLPCDKCQRPLCNVVFDKEKRQIVLRLESFLLHRLSADMFKQ